jgi:hypothetical protein
MIPAHEARNYDDYKRWRKLARKIERKAKKVKNKPSGERFLDLDEFFDSDLFDLTFSYQEELENFGYKVSLDISPDSIFGKIRIEW